ncbi:MAG: D-alanyl-D-alanine carboxypeptidase/D-alanyl-D-alanine-endopeptidase [Bryobacteraceae bacterium]|jgi:D-alanyl-D-alanine carboxypeptidase/D-alanyl-D-alanine-endopeptidase (penicillin-binding protein 4)
MTAAPFILALSLVVPGQAASPALAIERLVESSPAARGAFWGIQVTDLKTGRTIYQRNADRLFVPASNTKLFTTALALERLGPQFTFETRVTADRPPDADGCIRGSLRLVGGGDPNLSARAVPYQPEPARAAPAPGYALAALAELADQVVAKGVKCVDGDIVGDDTWYVWEPYAEDWSIDDPTYEYGAAVSALALNDNALTVSVSPAAREGDPAAIALEPAVEYYSIDNRIRTVPAGAAGGEHAIHVHRAPGSLELELSGTIPLGGPAQLLAFGIEDPADYAALALRQLLEERGVTVNGGVVARHLLPGDAADGPTPEADSVALARHVSAPLVEDLRIIDKASQNLHAELALRAVGRVRRNVGSRAAGLDELRAFLTEAGVADASYNIEDGSGLSRPNLVTPAAMVKLLRYMYNSPARDTWISFLPVAGRDGTLAGRFDGTPVAGRIHAKTGTMAHVNALSGYARRRDGSWVAFSILVNNSNQSAAAVRAVMDQICILIWK